jgi:hypothetical protein
MKESVRIYCGYDPRESAGYHTFCQSVMDHASIPCAFIPLHKPMLEGFDGQRDGTNAFIYSRFLVPYLENYRGWAIFADACDMVVRDDIAKVWNMREQFIFNKAVAVVKHDYKTKQKRKYIGTPMEADNADYARKNWSSFILFNCAISEEMDISGASLVHFSLGVPGFAHYRNSDGAEHWHRAYKRMTHVETE